MKFRRNREEIVEEQKPKGRIRRYTRKTLKWTGFATICAATGAIIASKIGSNGNV